MFGPHVLPGVVVRGAELAPRFERGLLNRLKAALWIERAPRDVALQVSLITMSEMRDINYTSRGIYRPTDVLTFAQPYTDSPLWSEILFPSGDGHGNGGDPCAQGISGEENHRYSPALDAEVRADLVDLGVIHVCVPYVVAQCRHAPTKNLPFPLYMDAALVHAVLHALGYDHETPSQLRRMVRREQQLGLRMRALARTWPSLLPPLDSMEYMWEYNCR